MAALIVVAALALPAVAQADAFHGSFDHGHRKMLLITGKSNEPKGMTFRQWRADCQVRRDVYYQFTTSFSRPFDIATKKYLHDQGPIRLKRSGALTGKIITAVTGHRVSRNKWVGTFHANVKIKRNGRPYNRCKTGELRWVARRG